MKALQQILYSPTAKSFEWELKRPASTEKQITAAVNWILSDVQQSPLCVKKFGWLEQALNYVFQAVILK